MAPRRRTDKVLVHAYDGAGLRRRPDELIVEEPMAIQLDGHPVATTMRTPGHDFELAAGFCLTEGLLAGERVLGCRYCGDGPIADAVGGPRASRAADTGFNVVTVETGGRAPCPQPRLGPVTSSCGLCGSAELTGLVTRLEPLPDRPLPDLNRLGEIAERVRSAQPLFARTGAVHAAAAFDAAGDLVVVREDIGRHNAVDKVVGHLLLAGRLPASDLGLFVSSRASFELVQKAWAGGFGMLIAVSAPSSLAVHTARTAGLVLAGFVRGRSLVLYSPETVPAVDAR
jgi:FdhD protein